MSLTNEYQDSGQALVVTSDPQTWRIVKDILGTEAYETIQCPDPENLLASIGRAPPAVIVIDAAVSSGDPLTLCAAARRLQGCNYIPLILLTPQYDEAVSQKAYEAEVTAVFPQPIDEEALRKHIHSLGDTGRTLSGIRALRTPETDVLRSMPDAFFIVGKDGLLRQYLGGANDDEILAPEEIEGRLLGDVWPEEITAMVQKNIRRVLRFRDGHAFRIELSKDGEDASYEVRLLVQGRDRVLMIVRNISSDAQQASALAGERDHADTITGLTAKDVFMTHFDTLLADAKMRERGVAVFCIDIDRFTRINDTLGRAIGDAVLQVTAKRIERCLRSYDRLARIEDDANSSLTRISGDEFVLILSDIESKEDVTTVAERVQDAFSEPVTIENHQLNISPSIGIALYPLDGDNAGDLMKNARVALDEAKAVSVEGRSFFSGTMKFRALNRLDVKNELHWAIEKDQLKLHYLPRVDLDTGQVAGLEALLRWIHPLRGSVPLSEVIPLAEATGLIYPIGEWVLKTACQQASDWKVAKLEMPAVSINLSQQEFMRDDLATLVRNALNAAGLPAPMLEIELTERMLMHDRQADTVINALHDIGVGIVLDDFGQGRSSIAHLTSIPVKAIKIDRAFIDGVREPGEKQSICSAMIAMCRELGIQVIAEGVENELQVQFLREKGCDAVQGFLYTEPLPADKVPAFLKACREVADESKVVDLNTVRHKISTKTSATNA